MNEAGKAVRKRKAPLWLAECAPEDSEDDAISYETDSDREREVEELWGEAAALEDEQLSQPSSSEAGSNPQTDRQPEKTSIWAELNSSLDQRIATSPRQSFPNQQSGAGDGSAAISAEGGQEALYEQAREAEPLGPCLLLELPEDILHRVLARLPINILLQASGACKAFAGVSEAIFESHCKTKRWRPPRRPRGDQAETRLFPWRSLFRRHACQGCGKGGEFPVRVDFSGALAFLVCRRCAMNNRERLADDSLYIDLVGLSGKRLITKNRDCYLRRPGRSRLAARKMM